MTDTIEPAAAVLGAAPEMPRGTPALAGTAPPAAAPAAPPPTTPDAAGEAWDSRYHEAPPRLNAHGRWARLRGNAQRKALGKPPSGAAVSRPPDPAAAATPPPSPAATPAASTTPEPPPAASEPPPIKDGVPVPPAGDMEVELRTVESYAASAAGIVNGTFSAAELVLAKAWELEPKERKALTEATQRVMHHYQVPLFSPLVELLLVLIPVIGKRRNDPETRSVLARLLTWWRNRNGPRPAVDPYAAPRPAAGSSAPAPAEQPATANKPVKIAWIP